MEHSGEVTRLLGEIGRGQKQAVNDLLPLVYDELHRLAQSYFRRERGEHTLNPTALGHRGSTGMSISAFPLQGEELFLAVPPTRCHGGCSDCAGRHGPARG